MPRAASIPKLTAVSPVGNGAETAISYSEPYTAVFTLEGTADFLFHGWNAEAIDEKAKAPKGSKAKKTDDPESFVYRDPKGYLCIPTKNIRKSIIQASKFKQDPRSPRKCMMDLMIAALIPLEEHCSLGVKDWDYLHKARVVVANGGLTRVRPAVLAGWKVTCRMTVALPEYVHPQLLNELIQNAGKLIGVGDDRPTHGRFLIVRFETSQS